MAKKTLKDIRAESAMLLSSPKYEWLGWVCLTGIILLAFLMNFHTLTDTDIFWHLKTGEIIFKTHRVPNQDIFSFTVAGKEWIDAQWLFQLMIYSLYRIYGYAGMIFVGAFISGLVWLLIIGPGFSARRYFFIILLGLISLLTVSGRLKLRPELLTFFYISLEIFLIDLFKRGKKYALYFLPILFLFWLNSEGLWPIYFFISGVFLLEETLLFLFPGFKKWLKRDSVFSHRESARALGLCLGFSLPLVLMNPYTWRGAVFPLTLLRETAHPESEIRRLIFEFGNPFTELPFLDRFAYISLIVISFMYFLVLIFRRRVYLANLLLWGGFLYISVTALRNVGLFGVVTCALTLRMLAENPIEELLPFRGMKGLVRFRWVLGLMLLGAISWLSVDIMTSQFFLRNRSRVRFGIGALETEYPVRAGDFLEKIFQSQGRKRELKIFADAESSGYLIWIGNPEWRVYFDPRLEVYGEEFLKQFVSALDQVPAFEQESERYRFDVVVIDHLVFRMHLVTHLYHHPDWAMVYLDGLNVIFLRRTQELAPLIQKFEIDFSKGYFPPLPEDIRGEWLIDELKSLSIVLLMLDQAESALPGLEELIKLAPEDSLANYYLGWALNRLKRFSEARFYLEKAVNLDPKGVPPKIQLAQVYALTGEVERAVQIFSQLQESYPGDITICINLAQVYETFLKSERASEQWLRCWRIYQSAPQRYGSAGFEIERALERMRKPK